MKRNLSAAIFALAAFSLLLSSCGEKGSSLAGSSEEETPSSSPSSSEEFEEVEYELRLNDVKTPQGRYFDPYQGVEAYSSEGDNLLSEVEVYGNLDYATPGVYTLTYDLFGEKATREVEVTADPEYGKEDEPYIYSSSKPYVISKGRPVSGKYSGSASASYLTDGDLSTRYESPWEEGPFDLDVDLGAVLPITSIKIHFESASAKAYEILLSEDGEEYRLLESITDGAYGARVDSFDCSAKARYVRVRLKQRNMEEYGYSLYEIEVYGLKGLAVPEEDYPDLFYGSEIEDEQRLQLDFDSPVSISRVAISYSDWISATSVSLLYSSGGPYVELASTQTSQTDFTFESVEATSLRLQFASRPLNSKNYRVNLLTVYDGETSLDLSKAKISASSIDGEHGPNNVKSDYNTFWGSEVDPLLQYGQVFDLGEERQIGDVDLLWDSNSGKVYDVYFVSDLGDLEQAEPVYRELAGYASLKSIAVYQSGRYLVVKDYSNPSSYSFNLVGITIHSPLPNGEALDYSIGVLPVSKTVGVGKGSYLTSDPDSLETARGIGYAGANLSGAIDSNSWWNSLLINNLGHANYLNPLRAKFTSLGLEVANPGQGYFETTWNRGQQVSDSTDFVLAPLENADNPTTEVLGYDDFGVKVGYGDGKYHDMAVHLYQGSPYIYAFFASKKALLAPEELLSILDLQGNEVTEDIPSQFVFAAKANVGYESDVQNGVNPVKYETHYYLVSAPAGSSVSLNEGKIELSLSDNYLSVAALPSLEAAPDYATGGYSFLSQGRSYYKLNGDEVDSSLVYGVWHVGGFLGEPLIATLPHQWKCLLSPSLTDYGYKTIRGPMKVVKGRRFNTSTPFTGISPNYAEPTDAGYSRSEFASLLEQYDERTDGNLLSADAYWQGKSLHPLAEAVYEANAIGELSLRDSFLSKIKTIFDDWFCYSGEGDSQYLYYDDVWGTLYYATSEFGANFNLADHHFTYGYFALALTALFEFDEQAKADYADLARLLVLDYMNYTEDTSLFCRFRAFDPYAGHSWAGGYADSDSGNNQESSSESLSSYASAYELGLVLGDQDMVEAAAYCYSTELLATKLYWFDYDGDCFPASYPYEVAGQVYGGSISYGTFFNGDPTYIYGIQWLPTAEYLSGYAYGEEERAKLADLYSDYLREEEEWTGHAPEDGYQHILFAIIALFDPDLAIKKYQTRFDEVSGNSEVFNLYYFIHSLKSLGVKDPGYALDYAYGGSVYSNGAVSKALLWNPTGETQMAIVKQNGEAIGQISVAPHSIAAIEVSGGDYEKPFELGDTFDLGDAYLESESSGAREYVFSTNLSGPCYVYVEVINPTDEDLSISFSFDSTIYRGEKTVKADSSERLTFSRAIALGRGNLRLLVDDGLLVLSISLLNG